MCSGHFSAIFLSHIKITCLVTMSCAHRIDIYRSGGVIKKMKSYLDIIYLLQDSFHFCCCWIVLRLQLNKLKVLCCGMTPADVRGPCVIRASLDPVLTACKASSLPSDLSFTLPEVFEICTTAHLCWNRVNLLLNYRFLLFFLVLILNYTWQHSELTSESEFRGHSWLY